MKSPWGWKQYGQCGKWISDLVPQIGSCADDIAFVHSMIAKSNVHGPATFMQNTGFVLPGFPSMGSWISYAVFCLKKKKKSNHTNKTTANSTTHILCIPQAQQRTFHLAY